MTTLQIKVKPHARQSVLTLQADGTWLVEIKARPVEGKANDELVPFVAEHFKLRRSQVTIKSSASGRMKLVILDR